MKTSCKIIEDLLPLYYDSVCSAESRDLVEQHLAECDKCRERLSQIGTDIVNEKKNITPLKSVYNEWIKLHKRSLLRGILCGICAWLILCGTYFGLTEWHIANVPSDKIEVSDLCMLSDGNVAFHIYIDDKYDLNEINCTVNKDGTMYITPKRAIIENRRMADFDIGLFNRDYVVDITYNFAEYSDFHFTDNIQPKAVYLGTEKDNILIWQKGMELPTATEKIENRYTDNIN